ncbi:MAG: hypothetical protein COV74_03650 [Candidatus Omnitrophica bacterium CG11_big_fil_rev_8_21_14_0_20_45_26]|uniref:VWFA domain-containing protein n=1 Tax=Candidatus Abzuiibacterium crystallinum TaxID=1974748 RepID=A0A2H0LSM4_9BACT|nr:MAG: hypothetical protein COV74_03650 [Candidatus Omnitrophica bacterium CG11_big_fil_rev_8_21_14_0_20_45_26]PIW64397.1 MAG: hypothetical protein COW12_06485 [Candidatus Omnitrophica bacterium CG12_big_fil_rev_8_21_14_0_65_45_16]
MKQLLRHFLSAGSLFGLLLAGVCLLCSGCNEFLDQAAANNQIQVETSAHEIYLGDQVVLNYVFLTRQESEYLGISELGDFSGAWLERHELPPQANDLELATWESSQFLRFNKESITVIPAHAGKHLIQPPAVVIELQQQILPRTYRLILKPRPIEIVVKDFPRWRKPSSFSGWSGVLNISSSVHTDQLTEEGVVHEKLVLSGRGNIQDMHLPPVVVGSDFQLIKVSEEVQYKRKNGAIDISKTFDLTLKPTHVGSLTIPATSIDYFNTKEQRYRKLKIDQQKVQIDQLKLIDSFTPERPLQDKQTLLILLDISKSMAIQDYERQSRLEAAKKVLKDFIHSQAGSYVGLETFDVNKQTMLPLAQDHDVTLIDTSLASIDPSVKESRSMLYSLLLDSAEELKSFSTRADIVVITDVQDDWSYVDAALASELLKLDGMTVHVIALGHDLSDGVPFFDPITKKEIPYSDVAVDRHALKKLAESTGGDYAHAKSLDDLRRAFDHLQETVR